MKDRSFILSYLQTHLKPSRYEHTLAVEQTAVALSDRFGADRELAARAALLHDAAKHMPETEALALCRRASIFPDACTLAAPQLLHAPAGAALAMLYFEESDQQIIDAIRYHTTGRERMSLLEKILYLADIIEPTRKSFDGLVPIREAAKSTLDEALLLAFDASVRYVLLKGELIHPDTILARNALILDKIKKDR